MEAEKSPRSAVGKLKTQESWGCASSLRAGEDQSPSSKRVLLRESKFFLTLPFCSIQALNGVSLHRGGQSALFSLPIKMLIASGDILTDTPRNNV